jgi:hypothetical protein
VQSREHIISAGIFTDDIIRVKGFPWCIDEFKEIGLSNLTSKVLCAHHNNALSEVDEGGIRAIQALRSEAQLNSAREKMEPRRWSIENLNIEGPLLERWFLKTLINVTVERSNKIGRDSIAVGHPSQRLVEIVFGKKEFSSKAGLYGLGYAGLDLKLQDGVHIIPMLDIQNVCVGGVFLFHGYRFFLYLEDEGLSRYVNLKALSALMNEEAKTYEALHHLKAIRFLLGKHLSHRIKFRWY